MEIGKKVNLNGGILIKGSLLQSAPGVTLRLLMRRGRRSYLYLSGQVVVNGQVVATTPEARVTNEEALMAEAVMRKKGYAGWPLAKLAKKGG